MWTTLRAGGAAHLPGMVAAMTPLPVIGVPVPLRHLDGVDSVHSILQMPRGVPVATVAIGNSTNAGLLAARIVAAYQPEVLAGVWSLAHQHRAHNPPQIRHRFKNTLSPPMFDLLKKTTSVPRSRLTSREYMTSVCVIDSGCGPRWKTTKQTWRTW